MNCYYRLTGSAALCGFKDLPFGIFDAAAHKTNFYNRQEYALILKCDGTEPIDEEKLSETDRALLRRLTDDGLIERTDTPAPSPLPLQYKKYDNMYKLSAQWSVTGRCNYKCRHCFMSAPNYAGKDLPTDVCRDIIRQMAECGLRGVSLTGGEPLVRQDLTEIIRECKDQGLTVQSILTNGALLTDCFLGELTDMNVRPEFQISFDGIGWHDWLRGIDGAQRKALDAIRLLKSRGFNVSCAMVLHKHNSSTIRDTVRLLASLGCSAVKLSIANPSGLWANETEHFLDHEEVYRLFLDYIPLYCEDGKPLNLMLEDTFTFDKKEGRAFVTADREGEKGKSQYACMAMRTGLYIGPEGQVLPCQSFICKDIAARYPNLLKTPLKSILSDSSYQQDTGKKVDDLLEANEECRQCRWARVCCGGCRAVAIDDHCMDYQATNKSMCVFFKNGWYEKFSDMVKYVNNS